MNVADVVVCALAREIHADDVVGVGLGTPVALCACLVARRTSVPGATVLAGGAVSPSATLAECMRSDFAGRTVGFVPHIATMDMAERQAMTLQFLRPAQVGPDGSANTSRAESGGRVVRFPGGLALADVPNLMPRIVLYHTAHERRALPQSVAFRTAAGGGIARGGYRARGATTLVTDRCVITFDPDGPRLASVHPGEDPEEVGVATGFDLLIDDPPETAPPGEEERAALDAVDPQRLRELEFRRLRTAETERNSDA